jgi:hypothetical protein
MTAFTPKRRTLALLMVTATCLAGSADGTQRSDGTGPRDGNRVSIGHDSRLEAGEHAQSVVSIFGSSSSAGEAGTVLSILGDTTVTGPVADSAVAVLGNTTIDGKVDGDAVAVVGNVALGPHAEVGGDSERP